MAEDRSSSSISSAGSTDHRPRAGGSGSGPRGAFEGIETASSIPDGGEVAGSGSITRQMFRVFIQNKLAVISLIYIVILVVLCIIVPFFYQQGYWSDAPIRDVAREHLLQHHRRRRLREAPRRAPRTSSAARGATTTGDCSSTQGASRSRLDCWLASLTMLVGTAYGIIAGYRGGGSTRSSCGSTTSSSRSPASTCCSSSSRSTGARLSSLVAVIGFTSWFGVARLMRVEAQILRDREFSQAARSMGATGRRVMWRHVLPNSMSTMVTASTFAIGDCRHRPLDARVPWIRTTAAGLRLGTMIQNASTSFELG